MSFLMRSCSASYTFLSGLLVDEGSNVSVFSTTAALPLGAFAEPLLLTVVEGFAFGAMAIVGIGKDVVVVQVG